jgi:signal transduction histidine kinase/ABC-type branched-subunit amino acid transport system ATPase component
MDDRRTVSGPPARRPVLSARGVVRRFGPVTVLDGIDLDLAAGELVALVGENGAGKSTLIRCLAGALACQAGEVWCDGRPLASTAAGVQAQGLSVVWQDLALCDNLDAVANLFLGRENRAWLLDEEAMHARARGLLDELGVDVPDLRRPVGSLSGGQRQSLAIARAILARPRVLLLDEPTAALGVKEAASVDALLRRLRASGLALALVSHRMEQVFDLADHIAVMRHGRLVAHVSPVEVHPDDVVALMSGTETDSTARRQLHRLHSLVDQLSEVAPSASLPLIVSAIATALDQEQVAVHLIEQAEYGGPAELVQRAALGLAPSLVEATARLSLDAAGGPIGEAAARGEYVAVDDLRTAGAAPALAAGAAAAGVVAAWAAPITGSEGVLGVVSGFAAAPGRLHPDQLELLSLYAGHAAAAIERERLAAEVGRRNGVLETLRRVLETLAGPDHVRGGLDLALLALARGLGADAIALHVELEGALRRRAGVVLPASVGDGAAIAGTLTNAAAAVLAGPPAIDRSRVVGADVVATPMELPEGRAVVSAWWRDQGRIGPDSLDLLDDAARSIGLAIEREALEAAGQEAEALRRSHDHQRTFLSRLSHELRTPLTAIQGYASSLDQPDVSWDEGSQRRFLQMIVAESARLGRLVGDLLDSSAIDSGVLRLQSDWCDLGLVIEAAGACVRAGGVSRTGLPAATAIAVDPRVGAVWGDHDRLEQVFVNLLENAARHGAGEGAGRVTVDPGADGWVEVRVIDQGPGIPPALAEAVFDAAERGLTLAVGHGLGLAIARGIVEAHGGTIAVEPSPSGATLLVRLPVEPVAVPATAGSTGRGDRRA